MNKQDENKELLYTTWYILLWALMAIGVVFVTYQTLKAIFRDEPDTRTIQEIKDDKYKRCIKYIHIDNIYKCKKIYE